MKHAQMDVNAVFYDIESLGNVFTLAAYYPAEGKTKVTDYGAHDHLDVYVLDDGLLSWRNDTHLIENQHDMVLNRIRENNPTTVGPDTTIFLFDLHKERCAKLLARTFGLVMDGLDLTDAKSKVKHRFINDTDPDYDPDIHPYLMGYNSYNYDTVMLAMYFHEAFNGGEFRTGVTAQTMRYHNDQLFRHEFKGSMTSYLTRVEVERPDYMTGQANKVILTDTRKWDNPENIIRQSMMRSGRHVDVGRLNEKMVKVGLKRLLGLIGCQILESEALDSGQTDIESVDQFADLVAYNVSDVVNLKALYCDNAYSGKFATKRNMLETYPELLYEMKTPIKRQDDGKFAVNRSRVRRNRLYPDSSSQQLSSRTLCPDGCLTDKPVVSLEYPAEREGVVPFDVLEFARKFYYDDVLASLTPGTPEYTAIKEQFDRVYDMYSQIRNHNFNESDHQITEYPQLQVISGVGDKVNDNIKRFKPKCMTYVDGNGKPTSCYVSFSVGGIHGAEYNKALYDADMEAWSNFDHLLKQLNDAGFDTSSPEGALALRNSVEKLSAPIPVEFDDGIERYCKDFLKSGSTKDRAKWKPNRKPELFKTSAAGTMALNKRYIFTSVDKVNHEDFTSYYPGLLRQMNVFANPTLGYDRYGEIFEGKERYGRIMKDKSRPKEEREFAAVQRENVKLILNSASGGGDASFDTPIRMNNNVIAMRMIGQLFTWYIGQAQSLAGARVPSTNTDGLYTVLEENLNNEILAREAARIDVPIEPEPIWLISKDSNNRIEFDIDDDKNVVVLSASGDLSCWRGPSAFKSLDHPAVVDYVLVRYMTELAAKQGADGFFEVFDREAGMRFLKEVIAEEDFEHVLMMFQNILASSPSSRKIIFALEPGWEADGNDDPIASLDDGTAMTMQRYNRIFMVREGFPGGVNLVTASGTIITPAMRKARAALAESKKVKTHFDNPLSQSVLEAHGISKQTISEEKREATVRKVSGIDPRATVLVENHAILGMDEARAHEIIDALDLECYLDMAESAYENNWRNVKAGE